MADRNPLREAVANDIVDDDPFAELTRIMGFDPREPVKPQAATSMADASASSEDFEIDLEKELMGEFGNAADTQDTQLVQAEQARAVALEDEMLDFDFSEDIAATLEPAPDPHAETYQPLADDGAHHVGDLEAHNMMDDEEFDAAIARSLAGDFAPESSQEDAGLDELEPAFVQADEGVFTQDEPALEQATQAYVDLPAAVASGDQQGDENLGHAVAEEDVHLDADAGWGDLEAAIENDVAPAQAAAPLAHDPFDDDFEIDLQAELETSPHSASGEGAHVDDFVDAFPVEPVSAPTRSEPDTTLEDELNALLNRMSAKPAVSPVAAEVLQVVEEAPIGAAGLAVDEQAEQSADSVATLPVTTVEAGFDDAADIEIDHDAFLAALNADITPEAEPLSSTFDLPHAGDPVAELHSFVPNPMPAEPEQDWGVSAPFVRPQVSHETVPIHGQSGDPEVPAAVVDSVQTFSTPQPSVPDIETVEVPERVVALADDLDIPDFTFEDKPGEVAGFDDIDADFADLLNEMNETEPAPVATRAATYDDDAYEAGFMRGSVDAPARSEGYADAFAAGAGAAAYVAATTPGHAEVPRSAGRVSHDAGSAGVDNLDYDPHLDAEMSVPGPSQIESPRPQRGRGLMLAAVVGAVAIVGGIGTFALSFGEGSQSGTPILIKADTKPIKVKPENPGGTVIPNQDNKVYDVVANGAEPAAPEQKTLVADAQEPVDVDARVPLGGGEQPIVEDAAGQKSEARLQPTEQEADASENTAVALVTPRKVRTMIVKPDGTLVPREDIAPAADVAAGEPADPAPQHVVGVDGQDQAGAATQAANTAIQQNQMPQTAPVAPQRPADQPVDVVGEVKPETVASIAPESSGGWSMQIASQPSIESAQKTYQNLSRRYESVLGGHEANIVKAEIPGKGTFYRVRLPMKSRDEAINLCTNYKAAGGNCFVSK